VGTVQGNGEKVLQVTSRTGAETCDVFEVVFYPALASHGRFRRRVAVRACKEDRFVRTATNEWRGSLLRGREVGQLSACDLRIAREETKKKKIIRKERKKNIDWRTSVCLREKDFVRRRIDAFRETAWRLANVRKKEMSSRLRNYKDGSD